MFVEYHVATAYYAESRLAFRDVKPHVALYVWIPAVDLTAPLWPAALIAAAEPTYKFAANIKRNIKYSRYQDIARMGRRELARGAIFTALPFSTTSEAPQVGKGISPTMQGIRRSRR
jgi:hypothetical protein